MKGVDLIILEGLDNSGKTTLAKNILKEFPDLKFRPSIGNRHDLNEIRNGIYLEALIDATDLVSDRARTISEYIYSPVLHKRKPVMDYTTWMTCLTLFTHRHHLIIFCHRPVSKIMETFDQRNQLPDVESHLVELNDHYEKLMTMMDLLFTYNGRPNNVVRYNWAMTPIDTVFHKISKHLGR